MQIHETTKQPGTPETFNNNVENSRHISHTRNPSQYDEGWRIPRGKWIYRRTFSTQKSPDPRGFNGPDRGGGLGGTRTRFLIPRIPDGAFTHDLASLFVADLLFLPRRRSSKNRGGVFFFQKNKRALFRKWFSQMGSYACEWKDNKRGSGLVVQLALYFGGPRSNVK